MIGRQMLWAGVDEVGRGPLVGAVVAASVILPVNHDIRGLKDSKRLTGKRREELASEIERSALSFGVAEASAEEIDALNIHQATLLAMSRAVSGLSMNPWRVLIDGRHVPASLAHQGIAIVKGDARVDAVKAASILAKVHRDHQMALLDQAHPEYGFAQHKGYPTPQHLDALSRYGLIDEHRRTFGPCKILTQ
jgi:ribonuclease HII